MSVSSVLPAWQAINQSGYRCLTKWDRMKMAAFCKRHSPIYFFNEDLRIMIDISMIDVPKNRIDRIYKFIIASGKWYTRNNDPVKWCLYMSSDVNVLTSLICYTNFMECYTMPVLCTVTTKISIFKLVFYFWRLANATIVTADMYISSHNIRAYR